MSDLSYKEAIILTEMFKSRMSRSQNDEEFYSIYNLWVKVMSACNVSTSSLGRTA